MITVRTMGGLGNQMFQYAFGLATANRLHTSLQIDRSTNSINLFRPFNLSLFQIPEPVVDGVYDGIQVLESSLKYDSTLLPRIQDGSKLVGYWQSEKYFESVAPLLPRRFVPAQPWTEGGLRFAEKIGLAGPRSVFLSVRRTDYVTPRGLAYHGSMGLDFYLEALKIIREREGNPIVFAFSDDIEWVKNNWDFGCETHYFDEADHTVAGHTGREDMDLTLMAMCNSAIVANTTFAWWAAWLMERRHNNKDTTIVATKRWFADPVPQEQVKDSLVPDRWIKI
jgi:hypothetical protein